MTEFMMRPDVDPEILGFLPVIFDAKDPRSAKEQAEDRYAHGGGWHSFKGFDFDALDASITYPGDPPKHPLATAHLPLSDELVVIYEESWVAILQRDGSIDICRMD